MAVENDPVGVLTTAVMVVQADTRVALYASGGRVSEQSTVTGDPLVTGTVSSLYFGAADPLGLQPASLLLQEIRGWAAPLSDPDALLVSRNLDFTPGASVGLMPVVSIPTALTVIEGQTLQIPVTKTGIGAASVVIQTLALNATAGTDYTALQQTVSFGATQTTIEVPLTALADSVVEGPEAVGVQLIQPSDCTLGNALGVITIT